MTRDERQKIYRLLSQYYPNARQLQSRETLTAYGLVLAKFTYADVKNAVIRHAANCKFFPDVAELVAGLPMEGPPEDEPEVPTGPMDDWVDRAYEKPWELCHVLRDHGHEGLTFGAIVRRYVPRGCVSCQRKRRCDIYEKAGTSHE